MNYRDLRLVRSLRDRLCNIEQEICSIRNEQERYNKQRDVQPAWIEPIVRAYQESETNKATNDNRDYSVQVSLKWATWFTFAAAAIYACITYKLLHESHGQVEIMHKQLDAMRDEQRPWIGSPELDISDPDSIALVFTNVGKQGPSGIYINGDFIPRGDRAKVDELCDAGRKISKDKGSDFYTNTIGPSQRLRLAAIPRLNQEVQAFTPRGFKAGGNYYGGCIVYELPTTKELWSSGYVIFYHMDADQLKLTGSYSTNHRKAE
jgi:hypothetical protein